MEFSFAARSTKPRSLAASLPMSDLFIATMQNRQAELLHGTNALTFGKAHQRAG
jgi:hypothetical protein